MPQESNQQNNTPKASAPANETTPSKHVNLVGQELGGCIILEKVAEGGMGTVFKAKHKALDRIVCVKVLSPALANDKKAVGLFLTEARAIAEIDHPNIVFVYNVGKEKGYHFIVMSYIEGESLSSIVRRRPNLPLSFIIDVFCGILQGLDAAHQKGIIHRDIKPSNILINKKLEPKIVDFGIAKKIDKEKGVAKTTELAGTAYFISPEQALGKPVDARTDLYALGASLFYVLTGKYPFTGKNSMDIIQKHINTPLPDILTYRSNIPAWLVEAVKKLMAKNPDNRFQSAKEALLFFKKSREDEKLAINKGLNISEEVALRISEPEVSAPARSKVPPVRRYSEDIEPIKKAKTEHNLMPTIREDRSKFFGKPKQTSLTTPTPSYMETLRSFVKRSAISISFVAFIYIMATFIFLKLGNLVSAFNSQSQQPLGFLASVSKALFDPQFVSQNTMLISVVIIFIVGLIALCFVKLIKNSVLLIAFVAILSYLTGVFSLTSSSLVVAFTGPTSLLVYSLLSAALAVKLNEKINFALPFKIISVLLFILGFIFVYLFAQPAHAVAGPLTVMIFYVLFALCSAACVSLLFNNVLFMRTLSALLFVCAISAVFFYQVSGNYYYLKNRIESKAFITSEVIKENESIQTEEETKTLFEPQVKSEGIKEDSKEQKPEFTLEEEPDELLYKLDNKENLTPEMRDSILWRYSMMDSFRQLKNFRSSGAVMLLIVALIIYGLLAFVIDIFAYKEEKWNLI